MTGNVNTASNYTQVEILREVIDVRRRVTPKFWLMVIVVTALIFGASFAVMQGRYARGAQQLAKAEQYRNELFLKVDELSEQLAYAQTDDYVMRIARDELGMILPSEVRYVNGAR